MSSTDVPAIAAPAERPPSNSVHAFYYAWYGTPETDGLWMHWDHEILPHWDKKTNAKYSIGKRHQPPDDIGSTYYPSLGAYSSRDRQVVAEHMRQLREAGVGVIAVSWYPPQHADQPANLKFPPDSLMPMLLDLAHQHGLEVTLHIEPYHGRNASTVRRDLVHLREEYGAHPALHRVAGRSLVYVYDSYHTPHEEWAQLLSPRGAMTIRGTPHDALVLGLCVGADDPKKLLAGAFDGFYTYFASRKFTYGSDWNHWGLLSRFAKRNGMIFVPSVGPGYDDTRVRPWNAQNIATRDRGGYYNKSWSAALESGAHLVSITSFNEWHEGTQIEAAARRTGYPDYGFGVSESAYLRLTRSWVQRMKLQQARSTA